VRPTRLAALVSAALVLTSCGSGGSPASKAAPSRTLTVFAASSLTAALTAAGRSFESAHSGARVRFSFAGSQALVAQLKQGAPADVLATADTASMAHVAVKPVSLEQDVKGVVTKVRLGEADAGIAYVTDVKAAKGDVAGTDLPEISNSYPVAVVKAGADATAFADFLLSPDGQALLASYGFLPPS
jgi:ABC-type molybdate transport system substrate-binding protein